MTLSGAVNLPTNPKGEWTRWLLTRALPLWSTAGYSAESGLYHERLNWDESPVILDAQRLMVQARQIATYCRATLDGFYDASGQALACLDRVERLYRGVDGQPGWIFSIASDGRPANGTRDLYAHAFILFAYAWAIRICGDARYHAMARTTASEIKTIFAAGNGGYRDAVPPSDDLRRQNPHMHLLEAHLALFEASGDEFYLEEARQLVELALHKLIEPRSRLLLEFFATDWSPVEAPGKNRVEPGHLFEWAWLLYEYQRLAAVTGAMGSQLESAAERLFHAGITQGCDKTTTFVFDAMTEDGVVLERTTRVWPQTELLRLLCRRQTLGKMNFASPLALGQQFLAQYAPERLRGGWIDRLDQLGRPLTDYMPASSLYHIYGPAREIIRLET
ncbi:mannose-6-phosphate isomerase [Ameyamaea chiangmaiensis NBRC 103196]|uniref:AGE family epimerase/isomerase n=1 Tax=Ameyamaea chiangmaiensis TaxID=442969 RepID=A0A850P9R2_9PROT|nr:AGE family epimerase/isomerase [Ameyamaea chiangmaiensis]MBS4076412.1 AGE family epimerase/isomerase [Ameyamaea chiangmaiensis]NVN40658.1 AGE family epimerase/isomerase [Ameyamaea chiangmaiensis]GBQ63394.1 mannose-6-phosphate isomerase [Ameyamaea chiangmaiensis NBRC 103196]